MQDIKVKYAGDSDQNDWDEFVLNHSNSPCYLYYGMRRVIESEFKAKTLLLIAEDEHQNVQGILFAYHLNRQGGFLFTPEFGVVGNNDHVISQLIEMAKHYALSNQLAKFCFTTGFKSCQKQDSNNREWQKSTFLLDLSSGKEALWTHLSSSSRNKIRKAEKAGIVVARGEEYLDQFYKVYARCYLQKRLNIKRRSFFEKLFRDMKGHIDLFVCLCQGTVVSGAIFLKNASLSSYLYNASDHQYSRLGVNDFLLWKVANEYIAQDLMGINLGESKPASGAYQFKEKQLKCQPLLVYYSEYENRVNQPSFLSRVVEKFVLELCRIQFLPRFLTKKLLIKRVSYGRLV